jgi:hypothetical protein
MAKSVSASPTKTSRCPSPEKSADAIILFGDSFELFLPIQSLEKGGLSFFFNTTKRSSPSSSTAVFPIAS